MATFGPPSGPYPQQPGASPTYPAQQQAESYGQPPVAGAPFNFQQLAQPLPYGGAGYAGQPMQAGGFEQQQQLQQPVLVPQLGAAPQLQQQASMQQRMPSQTTDTNVPPAPAPMDASAPATDAPLGGEPAKDPAKDQQPGFFGRLFGRFGARQ